MRIAASRSALPPRTTGSRATLLVGARLAWTLAALYGVYIATLFAGGVAAGVPVEPYLAAAEILTALSGVLQVALFAAIWRWAPEEARLSALMALIWMAVMAALTMTVHVVQLTVGRQIDAAAMPDYRFIFGWTWPSLLYAVELVAWHLFFGLALLFAAPAFRGSGAAAAARWGLLAAGTLCLAGLIGPVVGNLAWRMIGIAGYGLVFPLACIAIGLVFSRAAAASGGERQAPG